MFFKSLKYHLGFNMDVQNSIKFNFVKIERVTDKAWQIFFDSGQIEWLPKSQCRINISKNEIYIPKWLADDKDLSFY